MKTTLELPDHLMRAVKMRAVEEDRRIKDVVADLLRRGLAQPSEQSGVRHRVSFPLIEGTHPAPAGKEMTPERVAHLLEAQEADDAGATARR